MEMTVVQKLMMTNLLLMMNKAGRLEAEVASVLGGHSSASSSKLPNYIYCYVIAVMWSLCSAIQ